MARRMLSKVIDVRQSAHPADFHRRQVIEAEPARPGDRFSAKSRRENGVIR